MSEKQKFTLGFIFDEKLERVLLIKKNRGPKGLDKMKGLLNGLGGHCEDNETPLNCIIREVKEESDLDIKDWVNFCNLDAKFGHVYCFYAIIKSFTEFIPHENLLRFFRFRTIYTQKEDEELGDYWINTSQDPNRIHDDYRLLPHMANLEYLIPMALNHYKKLDSAACFEIKEIYD